MQSKINTKKIIIPLILGNAFEFYNFILFAVYAPYISKAFFQADDPNSIIWVYAISLCGYISRPFGALIFGSLADSRGRSKAVGITVMLTGLVTFVMGLLPCKLGMISLLLLVIFRFFQGFLVSGEEGNVAVYLGEKFPSARKSFVCSLVLSSVFMGILIGSITCGINELLFTKDEMYRYGWRIPFLISLPISIIVLYLRKGLPDDSIQTNKKILIPAIDLLKAYKFKLIQLIILCGTYASLTCLVMVWIPNELKSQISSWITALGLAYMMVMMPILALAVDKYGYKRCFVIGFSLIVIGSPTLVKLLYTGSIFYQYLSLFILYTMVSAIAAPMLPYLIDRFPFSVRCSGVSFVFNTSVSVFSGGFPILSSFMVKNFSFHGLSFIIVSLGVFSLSTIILKSVNLYPSFFMRRINYGKE